MPPPRSQAPIRDRGGKGRKHGPPGPPPARQAAGRRRETMRLRSGVRVTLRPLAIDDLKQAQSVFAALSEQTRYLRYQRAVPKLTAELIVETITSRTEPSVIIVATVQVDGDDRIVGGGRIEAASQAMEAPGARHRVAEFAMIVADAWQAKGIGTALLRSLCRRAGALGYQELIGEVLAVNGPMLALATHLGFEVPARADRGEVVRVRRLLPAEPVRPARRRAA